MKEIMTAIRNTLILWILTALIYPFFMIFLGQIVFPNQANGSLIQDQQGRVVGSALIGQSFTDNRYFMSRPSIINYSEGEEAQPTGVSGASNLAPSNSQLMERVEQKIEDLNQLQIQPMADLVYASGSGLDPHITPQSARLQMSRVAELRSLEQGQMESLINQYTERRFLGVFGEPGVNVLKLNLALDNLESQ